jgi:CRISPR-associated endonuclease/helicase Cas3
VTSVYDAWCGLKDLHASLIVRVAARNQLSAERILKSSLLCVALHDVGKLSDNFQAMMLAKDDSAYKKAVARNYRHEVATLWLVEQVAKSLIAKEGPIPGGGLLEFFAVAGHHKYLADDYLFDERHFRQALTWPDAMKAVKAGSGLAREMFQQQGWTFPVKGLSRSDVENHLTADASEGRNEPYDLLIKRSRNLSSLEDGRYEPRRELFLLLKGLLMTADWMASGAAGREDDLDARKGVVRIGPGGLEGYLRERVERRQEERPGASPDGFSGYKPFQERCGAAEGHVIAVAPTGSGKTEASWLWALNQVERGHARKIFVLLPTMVTANSLHDRLVAFFHEKHGHEVGLVHSTADLVRASVGDEDEADRADVRSTHLSETHFFRPVTVGTVDQLLVPLFHAGRWAMKTFAAADAAIVIDEVHAYDPHTLGLITLMIEQLGALGARFMVMSATMPEILRATLQNALAVSGTAVTPVEDMDLLDSARNVWETRDEPLSKWMFARDAEGHLVPSPGFLDLWGSRNDRGEPLKILVVVNTVKRCQELAKGLREFGFDLVCYHSKFIFGDRREKERRIDNPGGPPRLLIATQVVEVSLDIDYDILLTECAPIDALIQRAGRVNRARRATMGRVVVHPHEEGDEKIYRFPVAILEASWRACAATTEPPTERDLIRMVEEVYSGHAPAESNLFKEIRSIVIDGQERLNGVLDSPRPYEDDARKKTRREDYPQVGVIPHGFAEEARKALPRDRRRFELKVPVWYARSHKVEGFDDLPVCRMGYGAEFGAELIATKEYPEPNQMLF